MPLSIDLALLLVGGLVLGLAAAMLVGQAIGSALATLARPHGGEGPQSRH